MRQQVTEVLSENSAPTRNRIRIFPSAFRISRGQIWPLQTGPVHIACSKCHLPSLSPANSSNGDTWTDAGGVRYATSGVRQS